MGLMRCSVMHDRVVHLLYSTHYARYSRSDGKLCQMIFLDKGTVLFASISQIGTWLFSNGIVAYGRDKHLAGNDRISGHHLSLYV